MSKGHSVGLGVAISERRCLYVRSRQIITHALIINYMPGWARVLFIIARLEVRHKGAPGEKSMTILDLKLTEVDSKSCLSFSIGGWNQGLLQTRKKNPMGAVGESQALQVKATCRMSAGH